ncbi:MAG: erythromycin esterase family protein [Chitinivibrionales bacterium]|nr:erythromycin esterase family protein [Chitinivibrionales bacterium]
MNSELQIYDSINREALPFIGVTGDYDEILAQAHSSRYVLIGEASHGTHEFYRIRAELTARLIAEHGFNAVAVEADWPDAYRVNRYVKHRSDDLEAIDSLQDFKRFPAWMWRNIDVVDFIGFLREYNRGKPPYEMAGFYGLDLYSLYGSIDSVIRYLDQVDPDAAEKARKRYSCFEQYGREEESYGMAMSYVSENCREEALRQLQDLQRQSLEYISRNGLIAEDEQFFAEQSAKVALNSEGYFRAMFGGRVSTWNMRDRHMMEIAEALTDHIRKRREPKMVIWAHNSHIGDSRATEMSSRGQINIGQLMRERYGNRSLSIGFTTHTGTVSAASRWGGLVQRKTISPSLQESYENILHRAEYNSFALLLKQGNEKLREALMRSRLERAIGVIYMPETERVSHYFEVTLPQQFDMVIHIDNTHALEPLELTEQWQAGELPQTYGAGGL